NRKLVRDAVRESNAFQSRARHDQAVRRPDRAATGQALLFALVKLAHTRVGGAAKMDDLDFGKQPAHVSGAPDRVGADLEPLATRAPEIVERNARSQYEHVRGWIARQGCADNEPRRVLIARHVLQRVHRRVEFAGADGIADLRNERSTLAAVWQKL